jgi:hypothetical protein
VRPAAILLLACCACAGSGHFYPCVSDAGDCTARTLPDGGRSDAPFISEPVLVWHDGQHDASTDLVRFAGALYAAFRHAPAWQADPTAQVFIVRSGDKGRTWKRTAIVSVAGRDLRAPKLTVFKDELWLTATAWETADPSAHRTTLRAARSADGVSFTAPVEVPLPQPLGLEVWRPRLVGGLLVLSAWNADELFPRSVPNHLSVLSSADGLSFAAAGVPTAGPGARDGDLVVRASGEKWLALPERALGGAPERQTFCHSPAVTDWVCWSMDGAAVEEPALFEWNGLLFVAGRHEVGGGRKRTAIWQVLEDEHLLSLIADVKQSFGETGAPGVVPLDADHALLAFHSTSALDKNVAALGYEPSAVAAQAAGFAADVLAVELYMPSAAAGR